MTYTYWQAEADRKHWLINYVDTKAKCSHLKKFTSKGILLQVFICLRPGTSIPPPLPLCIRVYSTVQYAYSHREGGGGVVEPKSRLEGQLFTKLGRKCQHDWMYLQSINSYKHLPQSSFTGQFLDDDILLCCLTNYLVQDRKLQASKREGGGGRGDSQAIRGD